VRVNGAEKPGKTFGKSNYLLLIISYIGFVSLGFPDAVIGVAWPSVRENFSVHQSSLGWILFGGGTGYFISSFFSGRIIHHAGVALVLAISSAMVAGSAFGYSLAPIWILFALCSILHGLGSGAIDAGLNNYVAHHFSARVMNWLHACYCLGAMLGPLVMTAVITSGTHWRGGYAIIGATMLTMSLLFASTIKLWGAPASQSADKPPQASTAETLRARPVQLQMLIFFVYTGLEVTCGQWTFTLFTESRGIAPGTAGTWVSIYWGSIGIGRVLFGFVADRIGINRLLRWSMFAAVLGAALLLSSNSRPLMFSGLALTGLALAPIYPCLMTATPRRLGPALAAHAIGYQTGAAMIGAAALPTLAGWFGARFGLEQIPVAALVFAAAMFLLHEALLRRDAKR
jgi:fucose permease